jgi:hypothetical protein
VTKCLASLLCTHSNYPFSVFAAAQLATEFPSLDTFATLSPVPRFRRWFLNKTSQEGKFAPTPEFIFGDEAAMEKFLDCCQSASIPLPPATSPISHLVTVLEDNENKWYEKPELLEALDPILTKLAAKYLVLEKVGYVQEEKEEERRSEATTMTHCL